MAQREYVVIKRNLMRSFTVGKLALVHLFQEDTHTQTKSSGPETSSHPHVYTHIHTHAAQHALGVLSQPIQNQ